jgi:mono/diheme cytochrome c family protein
MAEYAMRSAVRWLLLCLFLAILMTPALAAEPDNGKRLAEARCAPCHTVVPGEGRAVSDAPPFEAIARKFSVSPELLAFALLDPHPRMNMAQTQRETRDLADYISTLAK